MIITPNDSIAKANKANTSITRKFGKNEWYVSSKVENNKDFGYFLNVQTTNDGFQEAKDALPLFIRDTFILVTTN